MKIMVVFYSYMFVHGFQVKENFSYFSFLGNIFL
jgi:hypothetical protein